MNTRWNSCAFPMAATPVPSARINRSRCGRITSSLRSPFAKLSTGMSWSAANPATSRRNRSPIFSRIAGDGIGNPKCAVKKPTT